MDIKQLIIEKADRLYESDDSLKRDELIDFINEELGEEKLQYSSEINKYFEEIFSDTKIEKTKKKKIKEVYFNNSNSLSLYSPDRVDEDIKTLENNYQSPNDRIAKFILDSFIIESQLIQVDSSDIENQLDKIVSLRKDDDEVSLGRIGRLITGASKVEDAYGNAWLVYERFINLLNTYENQKGFLLSNIDQIENLRNGLKNLREDIVERLIEIFGVDRVQNEFPELFNYNEIEFLETESYRNKADSKFEQISIECDTFMNITHQNHVKNLGNIALNGAEKVGRILSKKSLNNTKTKNQAISAGVDMAFNIAERWWEGRKEAERVANNLNSEVEVMRTYLRNDKEKFENDLIRLCEISGIIAGEYIPYFKKLLYKFNEIIYNSFWNTIVDLYNEDQIKEIKEEKNKIVERKRQLVLLIRDAKDNILGLDNEIVIVEGQIENITPDYNYCMKNEPSDSTNFQRLLSLGFSDRVYKKVHDQWKLAASPTIEEYKSLNEFKDIVEKKKQKYTEYIVEYKNEYKEKENSIEELNKKLNKLFEGFENHKKSIKNYSKELSDLIKYSKYLLEKRLDEDLLTFSN